MKIPSLAPQRPPWYRLLAAGDTFQDEEGIVYTVVYVDESGRADIEWFSPSCKRLLRSREHISDRWIAASVKSCVRDNLWQALNSALNEKFAIRDSAPKTPPPTAKEGGGK